MFSTRQCVAVLSLLFLSGCGQPVSNEKYSMPLQAWDSPNAPDNMGRGLDLRVSRLPLEGQLDSEPWTDTYWPSNYAGIAQRWNDPSIKDKEGHFNYKTPNILSLKFMSLEEKKKLSPAEKFDIYRGRFDFPTVKAEWERVSPDKPDWEGLCHAWSPAALIYKEPKAVTLKGPFGIEIPFGSSDVKALLTYHVHSKRGRSTGFMGRRCDLDTVKEPATVRLLDCTDVNAGAFHAVVTNLIGLQKRGFTLDQTRDAEVWNQPAHAYVSRVITMRGPSLGASPEAVRELVIEMKLTFTVEVDPLWDTTTSSDTRTYRYTLEINSQDEIVGGEWLDENFQRSDEADRPDFLWASEAPSFDIDDEAKKVSEIYKASIGQN